MQNAQCSKSASANRVKMNQISHLSKRNQIYLDMERLQIWKTSEVVSQLLESNARSKLHLYGQDLDTGDSFLLGPSLQCSQIEMN